MDKEAGGAFVVGVGMKQTDARLVTVTIISFPSHHTQFAESDFLIRICCHFSDHKEEMSAFAASRLALRSISRYVTKLSHSKLYIDY